MAQPTTAPTPTAAAGCDRCGHFVEAAEGHPWRREDISRTAPTGLAYDCRPNPHQPGTWYPHTVDGRSHNVAPEDD